MLCRVSSGIVLCGVRSSKGFYDGARGGGTYVWLESRIGCIHPRKGQLHTSMIEMEKVMPEACT